MLDGGLRGMIRDAARQAFRTVLARDPGESTYAFALQTLSDCSGVYAHANTETHYLQTLAEYRARWPDEDECYSRDICRWRWAYWSCRNVEFGEFRAVYEYCNRVEDPPIREDDRLDLEVYTAMIAALGDLDRERLFGIASVRSGRTLLCSIHDSGYDTWFRREPAVRLNAAGVYSRFESLTEDGEKKLAYYQRWRDATVLRTQNVLDEWGFPRRAEPGAARDGGGRSASTES